MSKTAKDTKAKKNTKKKITGFDIMYKVVTAVLAVAVFPVTYFMNLIFYAFDSTNAMKLINNFEAIFTSENLLEGFKNLLMPSADASEQAMEITYDYICLAKLDEFKSLINMASNGDNVNIKDLIFNNANLRPLVVSLALFAAVLVIALVILIVAIFKNKPKITAALSAGGVALGIASYAVFTVRITNPLVNGTMTLSDFIGSDSMVFQILGQLIGNVIELRYDSAFFVVIAIMIAILIWSLSIIIVNLDDKTEKALREAKKAEKKAKKAKKKAKKAKKEAKKADEKLKKELKQAKQEKEEQEEKEKENSDAQE